MRSGLLALVLGLISLAACPAAGQSLADADEAFEGGDIAAARRGYQRALEGGSLTGEALVRAYLRAGVLAMWTGDRAESERNLRWALMLDPDLAPPPELSPDQQRAFRTLRADVANGALLAIEIGPGRGRSARVSVSAPSLNGLRVRARATADGASEPWSQVREAAAAFELDVPATAWGAALRAEVEVALLDPYGNTLRTDEAMLRRVSSPAGSPPGEASDGAAGDATQAAPDAALRAAPTRTDDEGDDTGVIVGVTLAVLAALAGAGAAIGYFVWDANTPETFNLVRAP